MTHNWKIKKQKFFLFAIESKNFPPDKRHPGHRSRYGKYGGPLSGYGFLRTACQSIRIENFEKPYNNRIYYTVKFVMNSIDILKLYLLAYFDCM
jgi:hypothetical protein